jgi:hypothetical protein
VPNSLEALAKKSKDLLRPFGDLDVLLFYGLVAPKLRKFLAGKELAAKNWMKPGGPMPPYLIKRGSALEPLAIGELADGVTVELLQKRANPDWKKIQPTLTGLPKKLSAYFLPRKLSDFFYATNGEKPGRPVERVFLDLDRGAKRSHWEAQEAARALLGVMRDDADFKAGPGKLVKGEPFVAWTGSSFHVYLFLAKPEPAKFYDKHFQYAKGDPEGSFTGRWASRVAKEVGFRVAGGHEKLDDAVVIDPSQTPSGKLCRVPLGSLHMREYNVVDGVSLPVTAKMLEERDLTRDLASYTPARLVEELPSLAKRLPAHLRG